ncbi:MAG: oligosaccharide flippase family protein [Candidatus Cloacimonetes bacterium]|nr:oligosaccharide flippase family protein [Candidatus Cloacimonadota bacterium]
MLKKISSTFVIMVISMLSSFLVTIILGRILQPNEFGEFSLLKQIIVIGPTIAIFGLGHSYIKLFSKIQNKNDNIHKITILFAFLISAIISLFIKFIYELSIIKILFVFLSIWFCSISLYLAANFRVKEKFFIAQLFQSGWKILLLLCILFLLFWRLYIDIDIIYRIIVISVLIPASIIIPKILSKSERRIEYNIEIRNYITFGIMFWLINSTGLMFGAIDKLIIPITFNNETLGIYTALSFLFTVSLTMIGSSIGYVIFPTISKGKQVNWKKLFSVIGIIIILSFIVFSVAGEYLVSLLFKGKYDSYNNLFFVFCFTLLGSMQFIHVILHFIIAGKGDRKNLVEYWIYCLSTIILFLMIVFISNRLIEYDLKIFTLNVLFIWFIKILMMLYLIKKMSKQNSQLEFAVK